MANNIPKVTSGMLLEALADPQFYCRCPVFFMLRESTLNLAQKWARGGCAGCAQNKLSLIISTFCRVFHAACAVDPKLLSPFATYFLKRHNWSGSEVSLYYKHAGRDVVATISAEDTYEPTH